MNDGHSDLDVLLEGVHDEATFIAFVGALASDFGRERQIETVEGAVPYASGPLGWENGTVDGVLEAAAAWGHGTLESGKFQ